MSTTAQLGMALRDAEEKYRNIFEHSPDAIFIETADGIVVECNPAAAALHCIDREQLIGMKVMDLVPPRWRPEVKPIERPPEEEFEGFSLASDGREIPVSIKAMAIEYDGKPAHLYQVRDITERKRAESERDLLELRLRQKQKLEAIGRLGAGVAHEINTPTQYVSDNTRFLQRAFASLLQVLEKYRELRAEDVATIEAAVDLDYLLQEIPAAIQQSLSGLDRVAAIVQAMKEFSHPGAQQPVAIDINRAIESAIEVARSEWKCVAKVETALDPDLPLVPCLPGDIHQVFLNLIVNAAHAVGDAVADTGGLGIISITTRQRAGNVEIRIEDTGAGIPEDVQPRVFELFFTTKEIGKGTGQGLAIAYDVVVKKHGGTLSFETRPGQGTAFTVTLRLGERSSD